MKILSMFILITIIGCVKNNIKPKIENKPPRPIAIIVDWVTGDTIRLDSIFGGEK